MKPKAILSLLLLLLLSSCSGGYYSHIPRTKTTVSHIIKPPIKELKDTVFYQLLPPIVADTIANIQPKVIEVAKLSPPIEDTLVQPDDTAQQIVSYSDFVKEVYQRGKKRMLLFSSAALLLSPINYPADLVLAEILFSGIGIIAFTGLLVIFFCLNLYLKRKKWVRKFESDNYSKRLKTKKIVFLSLMIASIGLTFLLLYSEIIGIDSTLVYLIVSSLFYIFLIAFTRAQILYNVLTNKRPALDHPNNNRQQPYYFGNSLIKTGVISAAIGLAIIIIRISTLNFVEITALTALSLSLILFGLLLVFSAVIYGITKWIQKKHA